MELGEASSFEPGVAGTIVITADTVNIWKLFGGGYLLVQKATAFVIKPVVVISESMLVPCVYRWSSCKCNGRTDGNGGNITVNTNTLTLGVDQIVTAALWRACQRHHRQ